MPDSSGLSEACDERRGSRKRVVADPDGPAGEDEVDRCGNDDELRDGGGDDQLETEEIELRGGRGGGDPSEENRGGNGGGNCEGEYGGGAWLSIVSFVPQSDCRSSQRLPLEIAG